MDLLETVSVLAVIISLLFVAYQIRQANRIATGTATLEVQQMALELVNTFLQEPGLAAVAAKLAENDSSLTQEEIQLARAFGQKFFVIWDAVAAAYENGLISETTYDIYDQSPNEILRRWPGLVPHMLYVLESWGVTPEKFLKSDYVRQ